jgi:hypothetical protein
MTIKCSINLYAYLNTQEDSILQLPREEYSNGEQAIRENQTF